MTLVRHFTTFYKRYHARVLHYCRKSFITRCGTTASHLLTKVIHYLGKGLFTLRQKCGVFTLVLAILSRMKVFSGS